MSLGRILASVLIGFMIWVGTVVLGVRGGVLDHLLFFVVVDVVLYVLVTWAWGDWLDRLFGGEP